jgi:quercetin dioxygenase-like cupin family protein
MRRAMSLLRSRKGAIVAVVAVLAAGVTAVGVALAASVNVTDTTSIRLRVVESEFEDGFDSRWHTHPGAPIVQVKEGSFKIYQGSCKPTVVGAGETYIEVPNVPVRAIATGHIKWTTTQVWQDGLLFTTTLASGADPFDCEQLGANP